jgi:hypothetical protein
MNIFYLDKRPDDAAEMHCDKHVCKMLIEYAQLMSTTHRIIDGTEYYSKTKNGHKIKRWLHPNSDLESELYKASHVNHPSNIWTRSSKQHYDWLFRLFRMLSAEYSIRYSADGFKIHKSWDKLGKILETAPKNIEDNGWVDPPQCMPDSCKTDDVVEAYRNYYIQEKSSFAKWNYSGTPKWFKEEIILSTNTYTSTIEQGI